MNRLGKGQPVHALYWGKNSFKDFIFAIRENDCQIKGIVADKTYIELSKEGFLIVKPTLEFSHWKNYEGAYDIFDEKLRNAGI